MVNSRNIVIEDINFSEALRYLGYGSHTPDSQTKELLLLCSEELKKVMEGKYIYKVFDLKDGQIPDCDFRLEGKSITEHLQNCTKVIFVCATIGSKVDALIRKKQITGMAEAMILDSLASVAVEQVCDLAQEKILEDFQQYEHTWRFGVGYGDFSINAQKQFLDIIDAPKRIGVCVNQAMMLTPTKSITGIIGLGNNLAIESKKSCEWCNFRDKCQFRKEGTSCEK